MRQIGTLSPSADPSVLGDHLMSLGIDSRAKESKSGWDIWVLHDDHLARAREEFAAYQQDPANPRYAQSSEVAAAARREEEQKLRLYRKNVRNMSGGFDGLNARRRPLTLALVAVCVAVHVAGMSAPWVRVWLFDHLEFFSFRAIGPVNDVGQGLADIHRGEVWRLITPIFLHGGLLHLAMNVMAMMSLGTAVEYLRGTRTLLILTVTSAVTSNIGEYLWQAVYQHQLRGWVGISGVAFALFGYVWMKGRVEPEHGMAISPRSVQFMLIWLVIGFTPFFPMANGAHVAGLVVGMLFGLARL